MCVFARLDGASRFGESLPWQCSFGKVCLAKACLGGALLLASAMQPVNKRIYGHLICKYSHELCINS